MRCCWCAGACWQGAGGAVWQVLQAACVVFGPKTRQAPQSSMPSRHCLCTDGCIGGRAASAQSPNRAKPARQGLQKPRAAVARRLPAAGRACGAGRRRGAAMLRRSGSMQRDTQQPPPSAARRRSPGGLVVVFSTQQHANAQPAKPPSSPKLTGPRRPTAGPSRRSETPLPGQPAPSAPSQRPPDSA